MWPMLASNLPIVSCLSPPSAEITDFNVHHVFYHIYDMAYSLDKKTEGKILLMECSW